MNAQNWTRAGSCGTTDQQGARIMKTCNGLKIVASVLALQFAAGCASTLVTDNLPAGSNKGFVEFHCNNNPGWLMPIMQLVDGSEKDVGNTGSFTTDKARRVACLPGTNTFFIKPNSCVKRVDALVYSGKVTPVIITFRLISDGGDTAQSKANGPHLDIDAVVLQPFPVGGDGGMAFRSGRATPAAMPSLGHVDSVSLAPEGARIGYVEFLNQSEREGAAVHAAIRYRDPQGVVSVRASGKGGALRSAVFFDNSARDIFVCPVGTNIFLLSSPRGKDRGETPVQVIVHEGLVTPVAMRFAVQHSAKNDFVDGFWQGMRPNAVSEPDATIEATPLAPTQPGAELQAYIGVGSR